MEYAIELALTIDQIKVLEDKIFGKPFKRGEPEYTNPSPGNGGLRVGFNITPVDESIYGRRVGYTAGSEEGEAIIYRYFEVSIADSGYINHRDILQRVREYQFPDQGLACEYFDNERKPTILAWGQVNEFDENIGLAGIYYDALLDSDDKHTVKQVTLFYTGSRKTFNARIYTPPPVLTGSRTHGLPTLTMWCWLGFVFQMVEGRNSNQDPSTKVYEFKELNFKVNAKQLHYYTHPVDPFQSSFNDEVN